MVFGGYSLGWSSYPYDEWRLMQMAILIALTTCLPLLSKPALSSPAKWGLLVLNLSIPIHTILYQPHSNLSTLLCIFVLMLNVIIFYSPYLTNRLTQYALAIIAITPILTTMWLPIETVLLVLQPDIATQTAWTGSFLNIRQYDDVVLPLIFLLLSLKLGKRFTLFAIIATTLMLWGSIQNGARAFFISLAIGISITMVLQKQWRWSTPLLSSLVIASAVFAASILFLQQTPLKSLARSGSSGRIQIWSQALHSWMQHPLLGSKIPNEYQPVLHPHNFVLQMLADYGVIGIFILGGFGLLLLKIIKNRNHMPPLLLAGTIAISCNSLFSGSMVYPQAQMANMLFIMWALSHIPSITTIQAPIQTQNHKLLKTSTIIVTLLLFSLQFSNLSMWNSESQPPDLIQSKAVFAPFVWQYGSTQQLHSYP